MKTRLSQLPAFVILGLVMTMVPGIASASNAIRIVGNQAVSVSYADLDLTKIDGVRSLYQRLKNAADQVCARKVGLREVIDVTMLKNECVKSALAGAVKSFDNELLQRLHNESGKS